MISLETLLFLRPEVVLIATATLIFVGGAFVSSRGNWSWLAIAGLALAAMFLAEGRASDAQAVVEVDAFGTFVRWLALAMGALFVLLIARSAAAAQAAEIIGSVLMMLAGLMLAAVSQDLIMLFLSLELISIPTYVVLSLGRLHPTSQEVATKYMLLSILSSALLLYGFSFLYGVGGSTRLATIAAHLQAASAGPFAMRPLAALAVVLIFAGLGFRLAIAPFHFYAPDVYQGANHPNAALLSVVPKIAGIVGLVRVLLSAMPGFESFGWGIAIMLSLVTMTLGNVVALWQDNVRRMLAYSSIAHGGYLLIGLTVALAAAGGAQTAPAFDGIAATLFYAVVYAVATTGAFASLNYLKRQKSEIDAVEDLAGVGRTAPLAAMTLSLCMFSLAGLPPLAGFWGKFSLLAGALGVRSGDVAEPLESWFLALAIVGVLNAAIGAAYYLRIVAVAYFRVPVATDHGQGGLGSLVAAVVAAIASLWLGISPGPLMEAGARAAAGRMGYAPPAVEAAVPSPASAPVKLVEFPPAAASTAL